MSKVDLGYHRLSEDADFVVPYDGDIRYKTVNVSHINRVREALRRVVPKVGLDTHRTALRQARKLTGSSSAGP